MLCLKIAIYAGTMSMAFHGLGFASAETLSEQINMLSFIIRRTATVDCCDWYIMSFAGTSMH